VDNSTISGDSSPYKIGDQVVYNCAEGFVLHGEVTKSHCIYPAVWNLTGYELPSCHKVCENGPAVGDNVEIVETSSAPYLPGSKLQFRCSDSSRYSFAGSNTTVCQTDGTWLTEIEPQCELKTCPAPPSVNHSSLVGVTEPWYLDEIVTYHCDDGYVLQGAGWSPSNQDVTKYDTIQCILPGVWNISSDQLPICVKACNSSLPTVGSGVERIFEDAVGGFPYLPGSIISYKCIDVTTSTLRGDEFTTCIDDGSWTESDTPQCKPNDVDLDLVIVVDATDRADHCAGTNLIPPYHKALLNFAEKLPIFNKELEAIDAFKKEWSVPSDSLKHPNRTNIAIQVHSDMCFPRKSGGANHHVYKSLDDPSELGDGLDFIFPCGQSNMLMQILCAQYSMFNTSGDRNQVLPDKSYQNAILLFSHDLTLTGDTDKVEEFMTLLNLAETAWGKQDIDMFILTTMDVDHPNQDVNAQFWDELLCSPEETTCGKPLKGLFLGSQFSSMVDHINKMRQYYGQL